MKNILFAAAGTGGHLFPAIAIASELPKNYQIHFLTTGRDLEEKIPKSYHIHVVKKLALKHQGIKGLLKFLIEFPKMFFQIRKILLTFKIDFVVGMGGYTSGPALLVAKFCGIPTALLEPNATIGLSNKLSLPFVDHVFVTFLSEKVFSINSSKLHNFGLPQLENLQSDLSPQDWDLIIMGGSQGAKGINQKIQILYEKKFLKNKKVLWQTGPSWLKENAPLVQDGLTQVAFVKNIKSHLAKSAVAISRTGAGACSDIVDTCTPSILIPISHINDPHYIRNAQVLVSKNAAILYQEKESIDKLEELLENLFSNTDLKNKLKDNLKNLRYKEAPSRGVANFIEEKLNVST